MSETQLREACEFAIGAIEDAIGLEDGLDGAEGQAVLKMLRAALAASPQEPTASQPVRELVSDLGSFEALREWCEKAADGRCCKDCDRTWLERAAALRRLEAALSQQAQTRQTVRQPPEAQGLDAAIGNVLDHWEQVPNDLRDDPGYEGLHKALEKLYRVRIAVEPPQEPKP